MNTSTPMPPTQCVRQRQSMEAWLSASTSDLTAQDKRQRADDREDEPAQRDRNITLTGVEAGVLRLSVAQERRAGETDGGRGQISRKLCFAVDDGGQRREEQKNRLDTEHPADQVANNGKIHLL